MLDIRRSFYSIRIPKTTIHLILTYFVCILLTSCQTAAQRQAALIVERAHNIAQQTSACIQKVETNPAYERVAKHVPVNRTEPTLEQLTDNELPSDEDISNIIALYNARASCREQTIKDYMGFLPGFVPIFVELYHAKELLLADLIQQKMTWGEYNKRSLALYDQYMEKAHAFDTQLAQELTVSHQAELAQRQQALNSLSQWAYQQQVLWQNQQILNSLNRPIITNCSASGNSINCSSY